jgi:enoyl-CoA hydratase/carnithine racemase
MAERAERVGILNHLVPSGKLLEFTTNLAKRMTGRSALAISVIKEQFNFLAGAHPHMRLNKNSDSNSSE